MTDYLREEKDYDLDNFSSVAGFMDSRNRRQRRRDFYSFAAFGGSRRLNRQAHVRSANGLNNSVSALMNKENYR